MEELIDVGKAMVAKSVPDLVPVVVLALVSVVMVGDTSGANTGVTRVLDSIGGDRSVKWDVKWVGLGEVGR